MVRLYKTFILPHFDYCSPLLIGLGKIQGNRLEDANFYILRSLLGLPKSETYDNLLKIANIESLMRRRFTQSLTLLYKCHKGEGPQYIKELFRLRIGTYNLRGIGTKLEEHSFRSNWLKQSYSSIISRVWNRLPDICRNADNVKDFRKFLLTIDFTNDVYRI